MSPHVRTVRTSSGATAVQIVYSFHRGSREIAHLGSAHSEAEVELLKAAARQRLAAGQGELDLGLQPAASGSGPAPAGLFPRTKGSTMKGSRIGQRMRTAIIFAAARGAATATGSGLVGLALWWLTHHF